MKPCPNNKHYWVIESPEGPTSRGVCKFCGEAKEFYNSMPVIKQFSAITTNFGRPIYLNENH